jgi:hypothetical protein
VKLLSDFVSGPVSRGTVGLILARVVAGKLDIDEAALVLGLSARQVRRLKRGFLERGPEALRHGNSGKAPTNRLATALVRRLAVYTDRHGIFVTPPSTRATLEEELAGVRRPTQVGRAFAECGIAPLFARSPQAKGPVERLFGTLQDRLTVELRLAAVSTIAGANAFLPGFARAYTRASPRRLRSAARRGGRSSCRSMRSAASSTCAPWRTTTPCAWAGSPCSCPHAPGAGAGPASGSRRASSLTGRGSSPRAGASSCSRHRSRWSSCGLTTLARAGPRHDPAARIGERASMAQARRDLSLASHRRSAHYGRRSRSRSRDLTKWLSGLLTMSLSGDSIGTSRA